MWIFFSVDNYLLLMANIDRTTNNFTALKALCNTSQCSPRHAHIHTLVTENVIQGATCSLEK